MLNFRVVWLDANFDETKDPFRNSFNELRTTVNNISIFIDANQSIDFVTDIEDEKIFMIISAAFGKNIVPNIHDIPQLHAIFIFCSEKSNHEGWIQQWPKVRGICTQMQTICKALHQIIKQWEQDIIPMSFITADSEESFITAKYYDQLDKSFMYMYLLKDVAFETDDNDDTKSMKALTAYSRQVNAKNSVQLEKIAKFEGEFHHHILLWWYTYDYFLFSMLNQALRTLDVEFIVRMGFAFRQLNHQISQLHQQQTSHYRVPFSVYRGQTLSEDDFQKLKHAKGGLLSFNSFLSTTIDQQTAIMSLSNNSKTISIVFIMQINPVLNTKPFAALDPKIACCKDDEKEILFCMHTVFRIGEIKQVHRENSWLWHVHLTLIPDDDPMLVDLDKRIQEETRQTSGWDQTGRLLMEAGEVDKAEKLYQILVKEAPNDYQKACYSSALAGVYGTMNKCAEAIAAYQNTIAIIEKIQPSNHFDLAALYTNIGLEHSKAGEYSQALAFYELALNIRENNLAPNHFAFSHSYINLGGVYLNMENWSMALFYLEKGLEILQQSFSPTHPQVKSCKICIKTAKRKLLEEEEKKKARKQSETDDVMPKSNRRRVREDECHIFGRNYFSVYVNGPNERVHYALYWLDMNIHDQTDLEAELCHIIPLMERFDDAKECEAEIKNAVGCTIVLIVAASMSMQFIPLIHDLTCVTKIFIYLTDGNSLNYEELMKAYGKITAIVLTQRDLIEKISEDWEEKEKRSLLPFGTVDHWDVTLESRNSSLLWFKLLISFLTRLENKNNTAKEELVKFMQASYHGNARQLENIDMFEQEYRAADAISWYTRDFCLYRIVNKAFRLGNINSLFSLRLFIQDLYTQLRSLHAEQRRIRCEMKQPIIRSFRGQAMLSSEVVLLSPDEYAIVSSFFSTSTDREQAFGFLVGGVANSDQVLVFFVVNANMLLKTMPFADISAVSNSTHENEVLYAPGTLFHIKSKRFDEYDDVWIVELELCDEEDFPLKAIYDSINIGHKNDIGLCDFSLFLNNMGEYKKAEKFLLRLLNELTTIGADPAECYHALGRVAYNIDDYDKAVSYHEIALDKRIQGTPTDFINLAEIYNDLAEGYCKLERINLAMDFNESAIEFSLQVEDIHRRYDLLSNCNHAAGKIHLMKQQYDAALWSLNVALDCRQRCYPPNHPFIADIYMSIGMAYFQMEKYSKALQIFGMVRDQFLELLPLTHPYIGDVIYNYANTELEMCIRGDTHETSNYSTSYFSEAYSIFQHSLPAKSCRFLRAKKTLENYAKVWASKQGIQSKSVAISTPASMLF